MNGVQKESKEIRYCLYARKSSESDERQTMSIDSQIKEMTALAEKEQLTIATMLQESHSAKASGTRPVFNQILNDIRAGMYDGILGILTWAPDRLSRNAGDLGMLVDLMDGGKLTQIKTYSQTFNNNPNEKFLLMILCSQAKLENDNRGINIRRGIRNKCEMGWRPGVSPLGYFNRHFGGKKDIIIDPERAPYIKEMFERVAVLGHSGRDLKRWLDESKLTNRSGKRVTLSQVYIILKNSFYYGEFQYPEREDGVWYKGNHEALITKELYKQVQKQLEVPRKSKWRSKGFAFRNVFKCASCKATITPEEKFKKLINGTFKRHVYYHCTRYVDHNCQEPYISEEKLIERLLEFIEPLQSKDFTLTEKLQSSFEQYKKMTKAILRHQELDDEKLVTFKDFASYVIREGKNEDKEELVRSISGQIFLHNRELTFEENSLI